MTKVVVLDDDAQIRVLLCRIFGVVGADGCAAYSSLSELQANEQDVFSSDLAVLDVNLGPGLPSGVDAHNWLIENGFAGRIVFLTGHGKGHPLVIDAMRAGSAKVYEKPLGMAQLEAILKDRADADPRL